MRSISAEVITTGKLGASSGTDGARSSTIITARGRVGARSWMICIVSWMKSMVSRRRGTASRRRGTASRRMGMAGSTMVVRSERYVVRNGMAMRAAVG